MKKQKKQISDLAPDLLKKINQLLQNSGDDSLQGIEISGLKFSESAKLNKQFLCCKVVNGEVVCKFQDKPCS